MPPRPLMTAEFEQRFLAELQKRSARYLRTGEHFQVVQHEIEEGAWTLSLLFENADRSLHLPVELAVVATENPKLTNDDARDVLVDFVGYFFDKYFHEAREVTLPLDWAPLRFGEFTVRARGWERNLHLEDLADRLLAGEAPEALGLRPRKR